MDEASPIQNVPDDVLGEIFIRCLPIYSWKITLSPSEAPLLLTHVCQRWRQVSSQSPELWRSLRWEIQRINVNETTVKTLAAATARANSTPRNLQLIMHVGSRAKDGRLRPIPDVVNAVFVPVVAQSLTRLVLKCVPIAQVHGLPKGSFPSVVDLALHFDGSDLARFPWDKEGPLRTFSEAGALRRVSIGSSPPASYLGFKPGRPVSRNVLLPWKQLTHLLDFENPREYRTPHHLQESQSLRYLFIGQGEEDVGEIGHMNWANSGSQVTSLDELQCVTIRFWSCEAETEYPVFLDAFDTPHLRALRLDGAIFNFEYGSWDLAPLLYRFLSKLSNFQYLTHLSLSLESIDPDTLRRILLATRRITSLDAFIYQNYESFFEGLTWSDANQTLPELNTLVLELDNTAAVYNEEGYSINPDAFRAFLESRIGDGGSSSFRKIVAWSLDERRMDDEVPFVEVALQYVARGLVFERKLVSEPSRCQWVRNDPELYDWPELVEAW